MAYCILSFSGRTGGNCEKIAAEIQILLRDRDAVCYDFSKFVLHPCGQCRYDCFQKDGVCPHGDDPEYEICDTVANSEMSYFIVPNYCDFPCANFFAFNERSQCYFQWHAARLERYLAAPKKFITVSNTGRENFLTAFRDHVPEGTEPDTLFLSARAFGKISIQGNLMDSEEARSALRRFLNPANEECI